MIRLLQFLAVIFAVFLISPSAHAADIRGVNLNLQKVWWNTPGPSSQNYDALVQENQQRLATAAADGFNLVRVLFRISLVLPDAPQDQRDATLRLISQFVKDANAKGMAAIVSPMGDNGSGNKKDLVCNHQNILMQTVNSIAAVLPDSPSVGLEFMNEPPDGCRGNGSWLSVQQGIYRQLRSAKRHMMIVVYGGDWGSLDGLTKFDPSPYLSDPSVLFTFHYYEFLLTSQGTPVFAPGCYKYVQNLTWPYDAANVQQVQASALQQLAADSSVDDNKRSVCRSRLAADLSGYQQTGAPDYTRSRLAEVANWANRYRVPAGRVFVGEIGFDRPQKTTGPVRPGAGAWLSNVAHVARQMGFLWAIYDLDTTFAVDCGNPPNEKICDEYRAVLQ